MSDSTSASAETEVRPFRIDVPEREIEELRRRIDATRWPTKELVADRSQGVQLAAAQELARYWTTEYDWRRCEARLNALPQFKTKIDGLEIHFIHVQSVHENALPLVMTHGWPGSVVELLETIGPLTDPTAHGGRAEDAFHLVLPSIPGYGFSDEPTELGWGPIRIGQAWDELMRRLGYPRYVAQGGDVGSQVTDAMARIGLDGLIGIHTNLLTPALGDPEALSASPPTQEERAALDQLDAFHATGTGYFVEQATRPETIGYGLLDSPIALAAWMIDHDTDSYLKIARAFVDKQPSGNLTREHIVDNITLYWLTGTGASAARSYWEEGEENARVAVEGAAAVSIPVGFTTFPGEIWRTPRSWVERAYPNVVYFNEVDKGGHFAAWEEPQLFSEEMRVLPVTALDLVSDSAQASRPGLIRSLVHRPAGEEVVALPIEGRLASFDGATAWLNSDPLTPAGLHGRVVVVDFWTYTCVNWLRTLPYLRAWAAKYQDDGLTVIGVHTPEFDFEGDIENVIAQARALGVEYPIAVDTDYAIWSAFSNHYWPALYIADHEGRIRFHHFGEGEYPMTEMVIQQLLFAGRDGADHDLVAVEPHGLEVAADWQTLASPETYVGYRQTTGFAQEESRSLDKPNVYTLPNRLRLNEWALSGTWTVAGQAAILNEPGGGIAYKFRARDVNLVMGASSSGASIQFRVFLDGQLASHVHGADVSADGSGTVRDPRTYQVIRQSGEISDHLIQIEFSDAGVEAYCFTFG